MTTGVRVASVQDLADGEMKRVDVGAEAVLLCRVAGAFHAVGASCPHYGAPLETGVLSGRRVICPWHHAVFDVTSGANLAPPALDGLPRFDVEVRGDDVFVIAPDGNESGEANGRPPCSHGRPDERTFVVLGGGAAGQAAAEELRRAGFTGRLLVVSEDAELPYDRPDLSKGYVAGVTGEEMLPLRDRAFYERHRIEVVLGRRVARLFAPSKEVLFADGELLAYDAALVATGSVPRPISVPGADSPGVFLLRTHEDARRILQAVAGGKRAVLVGSSFIAMELAASLRERGVEVSVVSRDREPFERTLGASVGRLFRRLHEAHGVRFYLDADVVRIEPVENGLGVVLPDGPPVSGDFVVAGAGAVPAAGFVGGVGREKDGGIVVDATLRAAEGLWAAGDVAWYHDTRSGRRVRIEHWRAAQQQGRHAARSMMGDRSPFTAPPFFWSSHFGVELRYVGNAVDVSRPEIRGSLDERSFIAYYLEGDHVAAAVGVGRDQELAAFHALLLDRAEPSADEVRRGEVDLLSRLRRTNASHGVRGGARPHLDIAGIPLPAG